jgi:hypothetical protein
VPRISSTGGGGNGNGVVGRDIPQWMSAVPRPLSFSSDSASATTTPTASSQLREFVGGPPQAQQQQQSHPQLTPPNSRPQAAPHTHSQSQPRPVRPQKRTNRFKFLSPQPLAGGGDGRASDGEAKAGYNNNPFSSSTAHGFAAAAAPTAHAHGHWTGTAEGRYDIETGDPRAAALGPRTAGFPQSSIGSNGGRHISQVLGGRGGQEQAPLFGHSAVAPLFPTGPAQHMAARAMGGSAAHTARAIDIGSAVDHVRHLDRQRSRGAGGISTPPRRGHSSGSDGAGPSSAPPPGEAFPPASMPSRRHKHKVSFGFSLRVLAVVWGKVAS